MEAKEDKFLEEGRSRGRDNNSGAAAGAASDHEAGGASSSRRRVSILSRSSSSSRTFTAGDDQLPRGSVQSQERHKVKVNCSSRLSTATVKFAKQFPFEDGQGQVCPVAAVEDGQGQVCPVVAVRGRTRSSLPSRSRSFTAQG